MTIAFEKRVITTETYAIPVDEVYQLLTTDSEYTALHLMLDSIKVEWEEHGGVSTHTTITTPLSQQITLLVIPPRHQSVRDTAETDDYYVEAENEAGYRIDKDLRLHKGRKRFDRRDCAGIAVALHTLMAEKEAARIP